MTEDRQTEVFTAMADPAFYPEPVTGIEQRETHISRVFLTDRHVYKVKKAVRYDFLDYSTLKKRRHYCDREVELNRRLSSGVYIEVLPITRRGHRLRCGGSGKPLEYAVKMRRLADKSSFLNLLRNRCIGAPEVHALAGRLAFFYRSAETGDLIDTYGSIATIRHNCEENFEQLDRMPESILDRHQAVLVRAATRAFLVRRSKLFADRVASGKIRDCHGDLRCGHVYFMDGIQIIDCIEFNDRLRYSDVACDLAFLVMDLEYEGFESTARELIDVYVDASGDSEIYTLLDFYKCYRAVVRSKTSCLSLSGLDANQYRYQRLGREARRYLSLAYRYAIRFTRPTLWVVCGLPASGKSTLAQRLSAILHLDVLSSDRIRKQLFDVDARTTVDVPFEEGIYSPTATALTYGRLLMLAQETLQKGTSVIIDASFGRERQRREALRLATDTDSNILFVECVAPPVLLEQRLAAREAAPSLSDARAHHLPDMIRAYRPFADLNPDLHLEVEMDVPIQDAARQVLRYDHYLISAADAAI